VGYFINCVFCSGNGYISIFVHRHDGVCYKCKGSGKKKVTKERYQEHEAQLKKEQLNHPIKKEIQKLQKISKPLDPDQDLIQKVKKNMDPDAFDRMVQMIDNNFQKEMNEWIVAQEKIQKLKEEMI
jgi:hypothetical protein